VIIHIGNQKGGCGKSTIAVNLASYLANLNKDVIIVDADRQATCSNWALDRYENADLPKVNHVQAFDNIRDVVLDLGKRYEYVIVDSAGRDSRELRTGITAANLLLIPFRPSQADLDVMPKMNEVILQAKDMFNPSLKCLAVFNMVPTNPLVKEEQEAREYMLDYPDIQVLDTTIADRKVYRDAMSVGKGVVEMENDKAIQEVKNLWEDLKHGS